MQGHNLEYRDLDIQNGDTPAEATIWLDIHNPFGPAEVRGEDFLIPQKPGLAEMSWVKHRRIIELRGFVRGVGDTPTERQQSFRSASEALEAVLDMSLTSGTLRALSPYLGLPLASEAVIQARTVDAVPGSIEAQQSYQKWSIKLLCIANPPEWEVNESVS